eukprot:Pgem_evm1s2510
MSGNDLKIIPSSITNFENNQISELSHQNFNNLKDLLIFDTLTNVSLKNIPIPCCSDTSIISDSQKMKYSCHVKKENSIS